MSAYYNEHDKKTAAWLRELIAEGHIAPGYVDERSILDVRPHELTGFIQQHFFAGIGGWSEALRLSGWPDNRPVRTGSCPCQPFSVAGQGLAEKDPRHLWPHFRDLIAFGEPTITFGEQVASADGRVWLAGVRADLEALGYEVGASDLCAAGIGAPHPRQRLYWMAYARRAGDESKREHRDASCSSREAEGEERQQRGRAAAASRRADGAGRLVYANGAGRNEGRQGASPAGHGGSTESTGGDGAGGLGNAKGERRDAGADNRPAAERRDEPIGASGHWSDFDALPFRNGKFRRVEAGTFPLAARLPKGMVPSGNISLQEAQDSAEFRVARLRGYGNSIVPQLAAEFINASLEAIAVTP